MIHVLRTIYLIEPFGGQCFNYLFDEKTATLPLDIVLTSTKMVSDQPFALKAWGFCVFILNLSKKTVLLMEFTHFKGY